MMGQILRMSKIRNASRSKTIETCWEIGCFFNIEKRLIFFAFFLFFLTLFAAYFTWNKIRAISFSVNILSAFFHPKSHQIKLLPEFALNYIQIYQILLKMLLKVHIHHESALLRLPTKRSQLAQTYLAFQCRAHQRCQRRLISNKIPDGSPSWIISNHFINS